MSEEFFKKLAQTIIDGEPEDAEDLARQALEQGIDPLACINQGLMKGIQKVGELFSQGDYFLPELIIGADAMKSALDVLERGACCSPPGPVLACRRNFEPIRSKGPVTKTHENRSRGHRCRIPGEGGPHL